MSDRAALEELLRIVDEVYRDRDHATRRDVYSAASAHPHLASDMLVLLNETPEGTYRRQEMKEAINSAFEERLRHERAPEPAGSSGPGGALEDTAEAEHAIEDDTTLSTLKPPAGPPPSDLPEFREPDMPPSS